MISEKLVSKWFAFPAGIIYTTMFVQVISIGDKLEQEKVNAKLLGKIIAQWVRL